MLYVRELTPLSGLLRLVCMDDATDRHVTDAHGVYDLHFVDQITHERCYHKSNKQSDVDQSLSDPLLL